MPIIKEHKGVLVPNLGNIRVNRCPNKLIKPNNWGDSGERKDVSKCKKMHVHLDAVDAKTNVIDNSDKVKNAFDVKVEAKNEVKVMMSKVKKARRTKDAVLWSMKDVTMFTYFVCT